MHMCPKELSPIFWARNQGLFVGQSTVLGRACPAIVLDGHFVKSVLDLPANVSPRLVVTRWVPPRRPSFNVGNTRSAVVFDIYS